MAATPRSKSPAKAQDGRSRRRRTLAGRMLVMDALLSCSAEHTSPGPPGEPDYGVFRQLKAWLASRISRGAGAAPVRQKMLPLPTPPTRTVAFGAASSEVPTTGLRPRRDVGPGVALLRERPVREAPGGCDRRSSPVGWTVESPSHPA